MRRSPTTPTSSTSRSAMVPTSELEDRGRERDRERVSSWWRPRATRTRTWTIAKSIESGPADVLSRELPGRHRGGRAQREPGTGTRRRLRGTISTCSHLARMWPSPSLRGEWLSRLGGRFRRSVRGGCGRTAQGRVRRGGDAGVDPAAPAGDRDPPAEHLQHLPGARRAQRGRRTDRAVRPGGGHLRLGERGPDR